MSDIKPKIEFSFINILDTVVCLSLQTNKINLFHIIKINCWNFIYSQIDIVLEFFITIFISLYKYMQNTSYFIF